MYRVIAFHVVLALLIIPSARVVAAVPATTQAASSDRDFQALRWFRKAMLDDYFRIGKHDPRWDAKARVALEAMARLWALEFTPTNDEPDVIWHAVKKARAAGCDDPLIRLAQARNDASFGRNYEQTAKRHAEAVELLRNSEYHPLIKCFALVRLAEYQSRSKQDPMESKRQAIASLDEAMTLIPAIAHEEGVPRAFLCEFFDTIGDVSKRSTGSRETYAAQASDILQKHCKDRSLVLSVMADFYLSFAFDSRGSGFADTITDEGAALLMERLEMAQMAAEQAWEIDNRNVIVARQMMRVELLQGEDVKRMERWFDRAMSIDPGYYRACNVKLSYLEPKWYGSIEEMLEFGRACVKGGRWRSGVPLTLIDAHMNASRYGEDDYHSEPQHDYFRDPEVWREVKEVYSKYLEHTPDSLYHRSKFATLACWAQDWEEAARQHRAMGSKFSYVHFRNASAYHAQVANVREHVDGESR